MNLSDPIFQDANKAREWLESQRWPGGPNCPHCGNADPERITSLKGTAHRPGVYKCNECREQFTVTVGSVMERSKIPLNKWALALFMMVASKKGFSAHQMHRQMEISYKAAWFMEHRIREAMRDTPKGPLGGFGKVVEADETYFGPTAQPKPLLKPRSTPYTKGGRTGPANKRAIVALVERGGSVRSFHVQHADKVTVGNIVADNIARESYLYTDESRLYGDADQLFAEHDTVKHSAGEYVRSEFSWKDGKPRIDKIHTNTIENVFSIFKRGMKGVYQHCSEKHLHRYLAEFDFRYNRRVGLGISDTERAGAVVRGAVGKRLMYQRPRSQPHA